MSASPPVSPVPLLFLSERRAVGLGDMEGLFYLIIGEIVQILPGAKRPPDRNLGLPCSGEVKLQEGNSSQR